MSYADSIKQDIDPDYANAPTAGVWSLCLGMPNASRAAFMLLAYFELFYTGESIHHPAVIEPYIPALKATADKRRKGFISQKRKKETQGALPADTSGDLAKVLTEVPAKVLTEVPETNYNCTCNFTPINRNGEGEGVTDASPALAVREWLASKVSELMAKPEGALSETELWALARYDSGELDTAYQCLRGCLPDEPLDMG